MKITTTYLFIHKQPLYLDKTVSIAAFSNRNEFASIIREKLTAPELRELKGSKTEVVECSNIEMNKIPQWFLNLKGKLNFKGGKLIE